MFVISVYLLGQVNLVKVSIKYFFLLCFVIMPTTFEILSRVRAMVFKATFSNISAISWRSDLLVEETSVHEENHQPVASH